MTASHPIGIFDSGIGGLTVAAAITNALPHENMIYFGDTAHLPYGDKSAAAIQSYAVKIADFLLQQHCKLIVIACYSATSVASELVKNHIADKAIVVDVIDPMVHHLHTHHPNQRIGLIGTRHTIHSNVYRQKLNSDLDLRCLPTHLLASAIEEFHNQPVIDSLLDEYLSRPDLDNIDALVLACTHYPIIKTRIQHYYAMRHQATEVVDPSHIIAHTVKDRLKEANLLNTAPQPKHHFYLSDYTESFALNARTFFSDEIAIEHYPLWD